MPKAIKIAIYVLLVTGAAVFSFPFLWMASTSVKVDRELQTRDLRVFPMTPRPQESGPYVDTRRYADLEGPHQFAMLLELERIARQRAGDLPEQVDADRAYEQIARGLYERLRSRLPRELWENPGPGYMVLAPAARQAVSPRMVREVFRTVYRRLTIGPVRLRSYSRNEVTLGGDANRPLSRRLENQDPNVVSLIDVTDQGEEFCLLDYDFSEGDSFRLAGTFDVPEHIKLSALHRIFVEVRPDDTWHELWFEMEHSGRRWRAERAWPLANYEVATAAWQPPGPDDESTKIRTWIRLEELDGAGALNEPGKVRITLEFREVGRLGAWWNKLALNYNRVLDHIPFWRYLRVSLFLVIANIALTVFVSSLVAYAFARLQWPGRDLCFVLMLATMMIPFQVIMIPQFLIWKSLGAYNTLTPLWLGPAFGSAFFIFLLRQFLRGIPRDLEDAARIDGCGFLRIYWHIMLPLIKPSLAAIAIFTFLGTWNNFMGPLIYVADQRLYPLAFGLYAFSVQVQNNPALTMAGSLLMTVPVIVIFFFAQKYFIQGVTLTGMKG